MYPSIQYTLTLNFLSVQELGIIKDDYTWIRHGPCPQEVHNIKGMIRPVHQWSHWGSQNEEWSIQTEGVRANFLWEEAPEMGHEGWGMGNWITLCGFGTEVPFCIIRRAYARGVWGRMNTCIWMAESLCGSAEAVITLLIGYTLIQNKC